MSQFAYLYLISFYKGLKTVQLPVNLILNLEVISLSVVVTLLS